MASRMGLRFFPLWVTECPTLLGVCWWGWAVNDSTGFEFAKLLRGNVLVMRTQKTLLTPYLLQHTNVP